MHVAACVFLLCVIDERMAVSLQRPIAASGVRIEPTACVDCEVGCLLDGLDSKILDGLYDNGTLAAHSCDNRRPVFIIMTTARLALFAAPTRSASQRFWPTVLCLPLMASGVIRVAGTIVRFYTLRAPSLVGDRYFEPSSEDLFVPIWRKYAGLAV
jgi:hypothetical protein